ncbi:acetate--CoA ligase family protein [Candidatus Woesearchaeota archaeon]|nr:acetate--CoA ligase family protein [Candidatus Woesearchaeota archaeon]
MKQMDFQKEKKLLERYKLPFAKSDLASSPEKALAIAKKFGYPVAIKAISKDIIHKSDIGGVKVNIQNKEELTSAYNSMLTAIKKKSPKAKIEGILIQKMESGVEVIIGMKRDPQFDAVVVFGLGGMFTEILKDVSFRIAPITKQEAEEMINEIKSSQILRGVRGSPPVKISALVDLLVKASRLAIENKKIQELDFNPVIVDEKTAVIVDVRILTE